MSIYFTSDTHFGHKNIIQYCDRPFANTHEMERVLVRNWNDKVLPTDTVYHLGDFAFAKRSEVERLLAELNGTKVLIKGNHDSSQTRGARGWAAVVPSLRICLHMLGEVLLQHKPGKAMLHGHTHSGPLERLNGRSLDVGADAWDYAPVSLEEVILEFLK